MLETNFLTVFGVLVFAGALLYQVGFFKRKRLGYFTLLQIIYLIVVPGLLFPMIFSYMRSITQRPLNEVTVIPDGFLINMILLSVIFTYGGIAIHAITKMLSNVIDEKADTAAAQMNYFFHHTFSHNLTFSGTAMVVLGLTILDLNHLPMNSYSITGSLFRGGLLALCMMLAIYNYRPYAASRWSDLKTLFFVFWLGFMGLLYGVRKVDPSITEYQLLLPALVSFAAMSFLSIIVVMRKLRHGYRLYVSKQRLQRFIQAKE